MAFVVDTSVALSWYLDDEATPATDALLQAAVDGEAVAPSIWVYEMANALLVAERRGRRSAADVDLDLAALQGLPIEVVAFPALPEVLALGRRHGLSAYDAAYLELALGRGIPLATKDRQLAVAAQAEGVELQPV